jgi:tetratricopeptide (TPR) repeat protein
METSPYKNLSSVAHSVAPSGAPSAAQSVAPSLVDAAATTAASTKPERVASMATAEAVVQSALNAHRDGALAEWLVQHRRVARWLSQRYLRPVLGAAGDALKSNADQALALTWLLRWAVDQMRPDRADTPISREDWLSRTSWRPVLSALCHYGFEPVQVFRDRYHPQADESPSSHLCGLWSVGPSTYYRYLEKAKRALATYLRQGTLDAAQSLSLRACAAAHVARRLRVSGADDVQHREAVQAWHAAQVPKALAGGDVASALWHQHQAANVQAFTALLRRCTVELANEAETDTLIAAAAVNISAAQSFELHLAHAALWRTRGMAEREHSTYEQALQIAVSAGDSLMLGRVYGALGRFYETRDADRAFAFYQDCTDQLWRSSVSAEAPTGQGDPADLYSAHHLALIDEYVVVLVRLGWSYALRNDPRSKTSLDHAQLLRSRFEVSLDTAAMLEQTWGEYWRRAGDLPRAIEYKHRALNLYERAADRASVLKTYCNLSLLYGEVKDFPRAIDYSQRVLGLSTTMHLEPELLASTRLNLGVAYFWNGDLHLAAEQYQLALDVAMRAQLRLTARTAHYNLAEVAYLQFKQTQNTADELRGDLHAAAALTVWPYASDPTYAEATKKLKGEILGRSAALGADRGADRTADHAADRLAPQEAVLYPTELTEVQNQRDILAVPASPEPHVRAHLRIANAYLMVAMKERAAALVLMQRHGLMAQFSADIAGLQTTFERELTHEQKLARVWAEQAADLLSPQRCNAVLAQLINTGSVNKSGYAELCGLSPATASKHLTTLAQRGLLKQTGNGPSTRYGLPLGPAGVSTISP